MSAARVWLRINPEIDGERRRTGSAVIMSKAWLIYQRRRRRSPAVTHSFTPQSQHRSLKPQSIAISWHKQTDINISNTLQYSLYPKHNLFPIKSKNSFYKFKFSKILFGVY